MTGDATWQVGTVTVPNSTGTVAVTGLGGTPEALLFFGTNWLTEDVAVTGAGYGLFRGMCAPQWDSPSTLAQNAACVVPTGDAHEIGNSAIIQLDTGGGTTRLYAADVTSLDSDGFTLDWTTASSGGYKVVYVALMDSGSSMNAAGYVGLSATLGLGWKAGACVLHGAWFGPAATGTDRTQEFYGGGAYPGPSGSTWYGVGISAYTFPTSFGGQYNIVLDNNAPTTEIAQSGNFVGPFLSTQNVVAYPDGTSDLDFTFSTSLADNGGMLMVWDDEDNQTGQLNAGINTGDQASVSGLPFAPGLVLGYTISGEPGGQGQGARGAVGFSVATPDLQWSATVLSHSPGYPAAYSYTGHYGAFQSFQRGFCDTVNDSDVHAGTIAFSTDGFVLTTAEDDAPVSSWGWHAFGHPKVAAWLPHIYRRVVGHASGRGPAVPVLIELELEEGGPIELEEGTGFIEI